MLSGYRFRAYPTAAQAAALRMWIGHQRFIYNAKVQEADYWWRFARQSLGLTGLRPLPDQAYSQFIGPDSQFLREVPSQVLRNGAYRFATGCARALKGLGGFPTKRARHGRQSVLLTSELFKLERSEDGQLQVQLGTKGKPLGALKFTQHRSIDALPKMLCISVEPDGRWFVSFCAERQPLPLEGEAPRSPQELAYEYGLLGKEQLQELVVGLDRGVAVPVANSQGVLEGMPAASLARIERKERGAKRLQRRMARQQPKSRNRAKTRQRIARCKGYAADVRKEFAHQVSHRLVAGPGQVFVFEALKLKNMTASPAPKTDEIGRYTANGAAAKAGLNKALLASALGLVKQYATYKAAWRNKLVLEVNPAYSSQECGECGHCNAANRQSQSLFACVACGHPDNADVNAARVIKARGIAQLLAGMPAKPKRKTARVRRLGNLGGSERPPQMPVESVSAASNRNPANGAVLCEAGNRHLGAYASGGR